ncbi:hypothetical protein TrispH2_001230 [Trichoplax sp. H2]|nr:hypothetical protein TrispH2_001230 [Trichoplax sp. H2]|eukprot:RDD46402.1 hypothetical protein TrispH2_001230 [Trichoplax sp. H2]
MDDETSIIAQVSKENEDQQPLRDMSSESNSDLQRAKWEGKELLNITLSISYFLFFGNEEKNSCYHRLEEKQLRHDVVSLKK